MLMSLECPWRSVIAREDGLSRYCVSNSIKMTVIFAIEPGDPALPLNVRGSLDCPRLE
jgi:hypothetical protein